jgi:uncharacterized protein (DUF58 family)
VWTTDRVERFLAARRGRRHALRFINDLLAFEPAGKKTNLAVALQFIAPILRRRSVIFLVSDFLTSGYQPELERLARGHDVIALQLCDARERELPNLGLVSFYEPESGEWRLLDTGDAATRAQFEQRAADFDRSLRQAIHQSGADLIRLETGRPYAESLIAFFRRRERSQHR